MRFQVDVRHLNNETLSAPCGIVEADTKVDAVTAAKAQFGPAAAAAERAWGPHESFALHAWYVLTEVT